MMALHSYPTIYNLGHRAVSELLTVPVVIEEKIDGSQFSFGIGADGTLHARSKGAQLYTEAPEPLFRRAVETAQALAPVLHPGWTYRGEYLQKPKHNTLKYSRVPNQHIIIFDINTDDGENYLAPDERLAEAERIGLETVAIVHSGVVTTEMGYDFLTGLLDRESVLGGTKIEGIVVKPAGYRMFGPDKKALMGKYVSEAFKESHGKEWKSSNPGHSDILQQIADRYTTEARWRKAIQHLTDAGQIDGSPRDIGLLMREVPEDVLKEHADDIKDALMAWAWPSIRRMVGKGLPEWYKQELMRSQFD